MSSIDIKVWNEANQRYLMASLKIVQEDLELHRLNLEHPNKQDKNQHDKKKQEKVSPAQEELKKAADNLPAPAGIDTLAAVFGLSSFERSILLMCAGVELDSNFASLVTSLEGDAAKMLPSFSLALSAFKDAHWNALSPNAPLRYWRLLELNPGQVITKSPVKIDEHILHYITGVHYPDERLKGIIEPVIDESIPVPSQRELANHFLQACSQRFANTMLPVMQLCGDEMSDKTTIAAFTSSRLGLNLYSISPYSFPGNFRELNELIRLWNREAALNACALYLDCSGLDTSDKYRLQSVTSLIENVNGLIILSTGQWSPALRRQKIVLDVHKPTPAEQLMLWKSSLGEEADKLDGHLEKLVSHFNLSAKTLHSSSLEVLQHQSSNGIEKESSAYLGKILWKACCKNTRPQVDELARRIEPVSNWDDLVLPEAQKQILKEVSMQVKQRTRVYNEWGFAGLGSRGLGISALFIGESGTGKTMASEVLANELQLDLYHIDLSQVVNKYIGETEKNLKRIFDAAEVGGAILLFDEADALFGKRSDVKDSHDRYANIEVSFLLQRMEAYRGLAILTTNMKSAIDKAFLRRIRFVVQFPFPDAFQRAEIWKRIFPHNTPREGLEMDKLARLNISGGNIRNIALNAAFIAADEGTPVRMSHISRAARSEYNKLEKPLNNTELAW